MMFIDELYLYEWEVERNLVLKTSEQATELEVFIFRGRLPRSGT